MRARPLLAAGHSKACRFFLAEVCPVSVECKHGFDVCPTCDPCTCGRKGKR